jgi:hypothetical protein
LTNNVLTGDTAVDIAYQSQTRLNESSVVQREGSGRFQVNPSDPAHASASGRHVLRSIRHNHVTQATSDVLVQATENHFHIIISLEVQINDVPHYTKQWTESVPRQLL